MFKKLTSVQQIVLSFMVVILLGSILLSSPFALAQGQSISYIDALFVTVSAVCVTGLTPVVVGTTFNLFGKLILLCLIQIGGLGLITLIAYGTMLWTNKLRLRSTLVVKDMLNRDNAFQFKHFLRKVIKYTLVVEGIGALLLSLPLTQQYGIVEGVGHAIFLSISAFCNAGFDLFGDSSLKLFQEHYFVQHIVMWLILLGGLGFTVWMDIVEGVKAWWQHRKWFRLVKQVSAHSKMVLVVSLLLVVVPAVVIYVLDTHDMTGSFVQNMHLALFQSVTLRTAGFYTVEFSAFRYVTLLVMMPIMFIGGASGGTAGGVKLTSVFVVYKYIQSLLLQRNQVVIFGRGVSQDTIRRAVLFVVMNGFVWMVGGILLNLDRTNQQVVETVFEATSALATVGISTGITATFSVFGKSILMVLMFIGRIGIVTVALAMHAKTPKEQHVEYVNDTIIVG